MTEPAAPTRRGDIWVDLLLYPEHTLPRRRRLLSLRSGLPYTTMKPDECGDSSCEEYPQSAMRGDLGWSDADLAAIYA